ncbi:hypothetical protein Tco_0829811 [Tanacetum coccineum]
MIVCVEKTECNAEFHHILEFIAGCFVTYALLVDPDVIRPWIQQFWRTTKQQMVNDVSHIQAKVAGRNVLISEATIREDLQFNDEDGTECFGSQFGTNVASALVGLATNQQFNFSRMIFEGMLRHIREGKPFLMYLRFIQLFLNKQLEDIDKPLNFLPSVILPHKVFTFMSKNSPKFSGRVTDLTPHMLEVAAAVMGDVPSATSARSKPTHSQSNPNIEAEPTHSEPSIKRSASPTREEEDSARHSHTKRTDSPNDYTPTDELKAKIKKLVKMVKPVVAEYRAFVKSQASLSRKKKLQKKHKKKSSSFKQGRKLSGLNKVDTEDDIDWDSQNDEFNDQMDVEDATLDETNQCTDRLQEQSTDVPTTKSTVRPNPISFITDEDIARPSKRHEEEAPQPMEVFHDEETLAEILLNMGRPREAARRIQAELYKDTKKEKLAGLERLQDEFEDNEMVAAEMQREERENLTEEQKAKFLVETIAAQRRFKAEQQAAFKRSRPPTIP